MREDLKKRRKAVYGFIARFIEENQYPPSYREIAEQVGIPSTSTVSQDVHALIREGLLRMDKGNYRSLGLVTPAGKNPQNIGNAAHRSAGKGVATGSVGSAANASRDDVFDIPVYGAVAAGAPIYADDVVENTLPLPASFFPNDGADYFVLQIHGDSMIEAGIFDGDHVMVRSQETARNGQQVVALIEDSATVKTFFRRPDHIELRPENPAYQPIRVKDCRILGIVCGLYRIY